MNLFEVVKANISTQEAAQTYGIDVNHYCKQNANHHSVICETVTLVCGKVTIFTVSLASPPNGKVDGVLLRTVLHGRSSERFLRSN